MSPAAPGKLQAVDQCIRLGQLGGEQASNLKLTGEARQLLRSTLAGVRVFRFRPVRLVLAVAQPENHAQQRRHEQRRSDNSPRATREADAGGGEKQREPTPTHALAEDRGENQDQHGAEPGGQPASGCFGATRQRYSNNRSQ